MEKCNLPEIRSSNSDVLSETQIPQRCMACIALALDGRIPVIKSTIKDTYKEACVEMSEDGFDPSKADTYTDRYLKPSDGSSSRREVSIIRGFDLWDGDRGAEIEETTVTFECPNI